MKLTAQWVVGFTDGEGNFHISINTNKTMRLGYQVLPEFTIVQHHRSIKVLYALKNFFGCGVVRNNKGKDSDIMAYRVRRREDLVKTIIPFFEKHPLKTNKVLDFVKFRKVILLMEKGEHLTPEGFLRIKDIRDEI